MRTAYDKAFKVKVAKDIIQEHSSVSQVANEYGISRPIFDEYSSL